MLAKKVLKIPVSGKPDIEIHFGIAEAVDMEQIYALRHIVYSKYGYFDVEETNGRDIDAFDTEKTVYVIAKRDERLLAVIRAVPGPTLPINLFFNVPDIKNEHNLDGVYEFGRLVIHRNDSDSEIPKNIILLMLIQVTINACLGKCTLGVAYIKTKLIKKLHLLKFPLHQYRNFECIYPREGKLHNYFYNPDDPPVPSYFKPSEVLAFSNEIFANKSLFSIDGNIYTLQNTLYKMFLKKMGIL